MARVDLLLLLRSTPAPLGESDKSLETEILKGRNLHKDFLHGFPPPTLGDRIVIKRVLMIFSGDVTAVTDDSSIAGDSAFTEEIPSAFIKFIEGIKKHLNIVCESPYPTGNPILT